MDSNTIILYCTLTHLDDRGSCKGISDLVGWVVCLERCIHLYTHTMRTIITTLTMNAVVMTEMMIARKLEFDASTCTGLVTGLES